MTGLVLGFVFHAAGGDTGSGGILRESILIKQDPMPCSHEAISITRKSFRVRLEWIGGKGNAIGLTLVNNLPGSPNEDVHAISSRPNGITLPGSCLAAVCRRPPATPFSPSPGVRIYKYCLVSPGAIPACIPSYNPSFTSWTVIPEPGAPSKEIR